MSKYLIVALQLVGLVVMADGVFSTPPAYRSVIAGGMIALIGEIEYRIRVRSR